MQKQLSGIKLTLLLPLLFLSCQTETNCEAERIETFELHGACQPLVELADCYLDRGNLEFSTHNYLSYLKQCDTNYRILANVVDGLFKMGEEDRALRLAERCLEKYPNQRLSHFNLAVIEYNRDHFQEALTILRGYSELMTDEELCYLAFDVAWNADSIEAAEQFITKTIELNQNEPEYRTRYAALLCSKGQFERARELVEPVYKTESDTSYYHFSLADLLVRIHFALGDTAKACELNEELGKSSAFSGAYVRFLNDCEGF